MGTELEHPLGFGENCARGTRVGEGEMGARELEPYLHGMPRKTMIELRSQSMHARQRRASIVQSRLMERDTRCRNVSDRA